MTSSFTCGCVLSVALAVCPALGAIDFYVDPAGVDHHPGTATQPVASLERARELVSAVAGKESVTVHVADGVYYLTDTLVFGPSDSGTGEASVVYRANNEGGAVLSGGSLLQLRWTPYRDGIVRAETPPGLSIDQLFVNGERQRMARYPNYDASKPTAAYQGYAADAFSAERAAKWEDPTGGYIHAMHRSRWGGYHYRITGKDEAGEVTYEGGWQNNRQMGMHAEFRMVENIFEELDAPGEWFHDADSATLYYLPPKGTDLTAATIEVVRLRHLVEFRGSEQNPVRHISMQGFVVRHAARTFMETKEPLLRSDWTIYRGGAFFLTGSEDIQILDTEFDQVGGNAVFVSNYNRRTLIQGCHIHDVGGSGVCFVGDPDAVRDPLFEYHEKNDLAKIDRTPGPKTNNYPAAGVVSDCLIHGVGRVERQPAGVQISMSMGITVRDTSVYDCARAGINIGDGCWGGHLIERCDVFDTVLETHDHGSFNSWGRDRFWHSDRSISSREVDADPGLPFLDALHTTIIRDSRWRCDHGWDIDLDDGSSNYAIYNNLLLRGGLKFREGFGRRAWNNIVVNNGLHPHVWYNHSDDEVFGNILMTPHQDIRVKFPGKQIDYNVFYSRDPGIKESPEGLGWDEHSVVVELSFVDPANGDFRIQPSSPAIGLGFTNFPMDQFGVKKPSLRRIARTPVMPELNVLGATADGPQDEYWQGARLHGLVGEEFSAFGVTQEAGGVAVMTVPAGSVASQLGLREGDLIQGVNGREVSNLTQFLKALPPAHEAPLQLRLVRDQQVKVINLPPRLPE